jgi:ADP-ribose pyrophosphatase YjhB (NUDIX family)
VRAAVISENKILLVKERGDGWTLPGGWVDPGESPSEAAVRETKEESGFDVSAVRLMAIYDRDRQGHPPCPFHVYKLIFLCNLVGGSSKTSLETEAACFFCEDELPALSESRVLLPQVKRAFSFARDPNLPADFD